MLPNGDKLGHRDDYSLGDSFTNIAENVPGVGVRGKNRVEAFPDTSSTPDQGEPFDKRLACDRKGWKL